ncbi:hypothetical protein [Bosea sp. 124]|uniref:hypothetical protein n=1 Tax=Bosea sp. 124 TaxID=2135642 RepID=UPI000D4356DB|nr:hypothetical protein [Bosea sp. 124]PTM43301.1 hypothetical protein C8D03_4915 [Bosea sp. 124]
MATPLALPQPALPSVSYGPFRLLQAIPWLMLAATMRLVAFGGGLIAVPAIVIANVSLLLAFVIVTWRMVLISNGQSGLGQMGLSQQIKMSRTVLLPIFGLMIVATIVAASSGLVAEPHELMLGFDGIAFDQRSPLGRVWSALVAALLLLMVLQVDEASKPGLFKAMRQFADRASWLVPGVLLVAAISILLHPVQGWFRMLIRDMWFHADLPRSVKGLLFFAFVFSFATVRLWLTVAILVFALRQSYRTR